MKTPEERITEHLDKLAGGAGKDPVGTLIEQHAELYRRELKRQADGKIVQFPSRRIGSRKAQVVYDEMRALAKELQDLTGRPVSFTAYSTAHGGFSSDMSPNGAA